MKKKFYVSPEVEVLKLSMQATILNISEGAGDPTIHGEWGGDDPKPFPSDDDLPE